MTNSLPVRLDDLISHITTVHPEGSLEQLSEACHVATVLDEQADHLIGHFVDRARRSGASWSDIGQHMGVSKQAVQKRFVAGGRDEFTLGDDDRLSRFTARAKVVLKKGEIAAATVKHRLIEPIHLLIGLAEEPASLAGRVIEHLGSSMDQVREAAVAALAEPGTGDYPTGDLPLSAGSRETLKLTVREALALGHNYVGTEHLLLGLLEARETAAEVLGGLGVTKDAAKQQVVDELAAFVAAQKSSS
ncbi:MAG: Clp protease N-terminal domain-containing protein [Stackebrandtia sp.]